MAEKRELTNKYRAMKQRLERLEGSPELIGQSPAMEQVRRLIAKVATTDSTVLILGETGTGKELVARAVHEQSLRAEMPLVPINCGALPENLIESELFGHRKGAFTGADEHRIGLLQVANGGSLFLDEIGELPKTMQSKLLRFLESGEVRRVGDNESFSCDVRVICATNRDLAADGRRRRVPRGSLVPHQHVRDSAAAAARADRRHSAAGPAPGRAFGEPRRQRRRIVRARALEMLMAHTWPGNVRELANVIEHALILCDSLPIRPEHLPHRFAAAACDDGPLRPAETLNLRDLEMQAIREALDRHHGNKPKAAEELGISVKTLYNKLNQAESLGKTA